MDKTTYEIRLFHWKAVIEQCSFSPSGQAVKQWLTDNGINEKTYYYWQRRVRKDVSGQINLPQPAEIQEPIFVSFAEIPVIPEQRETALETSFHADAVIRTGNTTVGLYTILHSSVNVNGLFPRISFQQSIKSIQMSKF